MRIHRFFLFFIGATVAATITTATTTPMTVAAAMRSERSMPMECLAGEPSAGQGARLVLPVATYDFGDVPRKGGMLTRDFVFRNEGSAPLVIVRVLTSCSCFKATFPKRPVAPGDQGVIRVTYEPLKSEPGAFNKVLQIYSNSVGGREVISVQGNSVE